MNWPALMKAGIHGLGLAPACFWSLTPAELALMLGVDQFPGPLNRSQLAELERLFPDTHKKDFR